MKSTKNADVSIIRALDDSHKNVKRDTCDSINLYDKAINIAHLVRQFFTSCPNSNKKIVH